MGKNTVLLCGFMGVGKTTVGKALAHLLGVPLLDTDEWIAQHHGPIPQIFAQQGEGAFRKMEEELAKSIGQQGEGVVSTGGGFLLSSQVRQSVAGCCIVYLAVPFEECYRRIAASDRPLVKSNTKEQLRQLYDQRDHIYREAAGFVVENSGSPQRTAEQIIGLLQQGK